MHIKYILRFIIVQKTKTYTDIFLVVLQFSFGGEAPRTQTVNENLTCFAVMFCYVMLR